MVWSADCACTEAFSATRQRRRNGRYSASGAKHANKMTSFLGGACLLPEEVARRLRVGKLYHEFKYRRWNGSKRDQFLAANPDCVLSARLMIEAVAAYKKQAKKQ